MITGSIQNALQVIPFLKPHHFALAIDNLKYIHNYTSLLGEPLIHKIIERDDAEVFFFTLKNNFFLEFLFPLHPGNHISRFINKMGGGIVFHHIAYEVNNIHDIIKRLQEMGFSFIDEKPRMGVLGHLISFIHPKSTNGVLVELVQCSS